MHQLCMRHTCTCTSPLRVSLLKRVAATTKAAKAICQNSLNSLTIKSFQSFLKPSKIFTRNCTKFRTRNNLSLKKKTLSVNILVHMSINFRNPKPTRLGWQKSSIQKFVLLQKAHSDRQAGSDCFHRHKKSDCN